MLLEIACQHLGWPSHQEILRPKAAGPRHYAERVEQKIGQALKRMLDGDEVVTGILSADPHADTSEAPIAVICQFSRMVSDDILREAQRLCWNFSRTALLITLEPHRIQSWTCSKKPGKNRKTKDFRILPPIEWEEGESPVSILQQEAAQALHWVQLVSGGLLDKHKDKFPKDERVDAVLVSNLKAVRAELTNPSGLNLRIDICHSLLARLIFTQFLFQRTDTAGRPAISQTVLDGRFDGRLRKVYPHATALEAILRDKDETYALFRWLNDKFNGDMFPGKGGTPEEREAEWQAEKDAVEQKHLNLLADFVSGKMHLKTKQQLLWAEYSFDTLPLEFISSVYEEFLTADDLALGAHYTPPHLVDFVLDGVLPWGGKDWDLKILDPCCGSSIFLVKAFQRLVQRWKNAHPKDDPRVDDLRPILENNLLGVDMSKEALRVASFSLCLALCDALDPKHYWKRTVFPPLRGIRLIKSDFFEEDKQGFRTKEDAGTWDLVIGNAPWGGGSLADDSAGVRWGKANGWPVTNKNPGLIFLAKAAALTKKKGRVAMIVPAMPLLYQNSSDQTREFRKKLFTTYSIEEVTSLTHLRWQLFEKVKARACVVTLQPVPPSSPELELSYICPQPQYSADDNALITIEPQDIHAITHDEAAHDPLVWSVLLLGGRRDLRLVRQLDGEMTLGKLKAAAKNDPNDSGVLLIRRGIDRGLKNRSERKQIIGRRILEQPDFPPECGLVLDAATCPKNADPMVYHTSDFSAFDLPQLVIKQSLIKDVGRFQAVRIVSTESETDGLIVTKSYTSIHQFKDGDGWLCAACLAFRSRLSAYFLALTSRLASDRAEALSGDILDVPIPHPTPSITKEVTDLAQVDSLVEEAFHLKAPESALIEDMLTFVYREGGEDKEGRKPTLRARDDEPGDLHRYADFLVKALRSTFGRDKTVRATIFEEEQPHDKLPMRMVAIYLNLPSQRQVITKEVLDSKGMRKKLKEAFIQLMGVRSRHGVPVSSGIGFQRIARIFVTHKAPTGEKVPTVLYLKPDQRRHWTRSQALRDADELAATIMSASKRPKA
ncbi:MAG TPA: SAM-dependent methyltransferase [Verrucomicrobiales bacterium]|nr:SAM-dependent methyltransferase [Verrucomicrobiales bacterium]